MKSTFVLIVLRCNLKTAMCILYIRSVACHNYSVNAFFIDESTTNSDIINVYFSGRVPVPDERFDHLVQHHKPARYSFMNMLNEVCFIF